MREQVRDTENIFNPLCFASDLEFELTCISFHNFSAKPLHWPDEWTATTLDGKPTAQFEHTLLITPDGVEPLTGKLPTSRVQFWELESEVHKGFWLGTSEAGKKRADEINSNLNL